MNVRRVGSVQDKAEVGRNRTSTSPVTGSLNTTSRAQADSLSDQENRRGSQQLQRQAKADEKAGSDFPVVEDAEQLFSSARMDRVSEQAVPTMDVDGKLPPQERAMQALSFAEEAVALGMFSESRFEAYRTPQPESAALPDGANCMAARSSSSESSRHSVSCAGMGAHGLIDSGEIHRDCGVAEWERDNAWMDEYRRGAINRCVALHSLSRFLFGCCIRNSTFEGHLPHKNQQWIESF